MIKVLLRARFAAMLAAMTPKKKGKQTSSVGMIALMAFLYLYLGVVFMGMFFSAFFGLAMIYFPQGMQWMYFAMFAILGFAMMFLGSVFTAKAQLFEAKDNELLLAMPVRPRDLLISRMIFLLLINYLMEATVAIPAAVMWAILGNGGILSWIFLFLMVLILPLFSLSVSCLLAWLISLVTSRIQKKSIFSMIGFLAFFFAYMYLVSNMDQYLILFEAQQSQIANAMSAVLPLYWIGLAIGNGNFLHFLLSVLFCLIPFVLTCVILSHTFLRIVTTKAGTPKYVSNKGKEMRRSSAFSALLRREYARLLSSSTYMLNSGIGVPMAVIATVALIWKMGDIQTIFSTMGIDGGVLLCVLFLAMLGFLNTTATFTAPSVSLEGKQIGLLRSFPIASADILRAKIVMHVSIMGTTNLICSVAVAIAFQPSLPMLLVMILLPPLFAVLIANIGLMCNLFHPTLDWINEAQAVKQGMSVLLSMLFSTLSLLVLGGVGILLGLISLWLSLIATLALLVGGVVLTYSYLMRGGTRRWENLI